MSSKLLEYTKEENFESEFVEFPGEMVELANELHSSLGEAVMEGDIYGSRSKSYGPILVGSDKKSLKFAVNLSNTRSGRETGENLYIVTIRKFENEQVF